MSKPKIVHHVYHHCHPEDGCDCRPRCNQWVDEYTLSQETSEVTCKNCLRMIAARAARGRN